MRPPDAASYGPRVQPHPDGLAPTAEAPATICCDHCGAEIGVYEPLILADHGRVRKTSRAVEPGLPHADTTYYHRACYLTL